MTKDIFYGIEDSHTKTEIKGQPKLWNSVYELLMNIEDETRSFLAPLFSLDNLQIILTGAGSSAFIGETAQGIVQKNTNCSTRAIATTDLVTHPELYLEANQPILLVSFARSGNSPESLESVKLADKFCKEIYHLFITCNEEGELMKYATENKNNSYALLLPEMCNDKSLAMTGSFTCMLLSILLIGDLGKLKDRKPGIEQIVKQGEFILSSCPEIKKDCGKRF